MTRGALTPKTYTSTPSSRARNCCARCRLNEAERGRQVQLFRGNHTPPHSPFSHTRNCSPRRTYRQYPLHTPLHVVVQDVVNILTVFTHTKLPPPAAFTGNIHYIHHNTHLLRARETALYHATTRPPPKDPPQSPPLKLHPKATHFKPC